jgi:hypothetical protein
MKLKQIQIQRNREMHQENVKTARTSLLDFNEFKAKKLKKSRENFHLRTIKVKSKELEKKKLAAKQQDKSATTSYKSERTTKNRVDEEERIIRKKKREIKKIPRRTSKLTLQGQKLIEQAEDGLARY